MPKFVATGVMDNGLSQISSNVNNMHVITAYTQGDSYAVVTGNSVCTIAMTGVDFTLQAQGTYGRQIVVAAKSGTASASSGATPDLHIALVDSTTSTVYAVTDELSDQPITSGNPITVPTWNINANQPT